MLKMDVFANQGNVTEYNCTNDLKVLRIPHVTRWDCKPIDIVIAQVISDLIYILCFISIAANIIKIFSVARLTRSWTTNHIYVVNLAIAHVFFLLSSPAWGMYLSHQYDWHLGKYGCAAMNFISALGHCGSILFFCVIGFDRMVAVYFPVFAIGYKNVKFGKTVVMTSWALSVVIATLSYIYSKFATYQGSKHFCGSMHVSNSLHLKSIRSLILFLFPNIIIPSIVLIPCYVKLIIYFLRQPTRLPVDMERAVKVDIMYVSSFVVLCVPTGFMLLIIGLVYVTSPPCHDECTWANIINVSNEIARLLNICNAGISPLIYFLKSNIGYCINLCDCSNVKLCSCECSQQPNADRVPTVQLVYIACVTDDPDIKASDCVNAKKY